jgi:hypothetical protein
MLLAQEAEQTVTKFHTFDIFVILFTIVIAIGLIRLLAAPVKNKFAIGFTTISLLVFLLLDVLMVRYWFS